MVKQIVIDDNNVVQLCSIGGLLEGGIDVAEIPNEVMACPAKWVYEDGGFAPNPNYSAINIDEVKASKIAESKDKLAEWLEAHPYKHTDGKLYACTEEKQALLNGNLASYERAKSAGIEYPLRWNSTGEECEPWEYSDLLVLSLSIAGYVAPRVSAQQALELAIKACTTLEEIESIVIEYE